MKTLTIAPRPYINDCFVTAKLTPHSEELRAHAAECQKMAACLVRLDQGTDEALARRGW